MSIVGYDVTLELDAEKIRSVDPTDPVAIRELGLSVWGALSISDGEVAIVVREGRTPP